MNRWTRRASLCILAVVTSVSGCRTHTEEGALFGGLFGAGTGAILGHAAGNPLAGAAIGAGAGSMIGAAAGSVQDEEEARNRALIEAQLGRQVAADAVTMGEVIAMVQARVNDDQIVTHIRAHGMASPPTANDLITLKQVGVSDRVVTAMQTYRAAAQPARTVIVRESSPPPVVIESHWGPYYGPPPHHPGPW